MTHTFSILCVTVPIAVPYNVAKKLVELLYMREIFVLEDEKQPILDALKLLKISGIDDGSKVQMQGVYVFVNLIVYWNSHS